APESGDGRSMCSFSCADKLVAFDGPPGNAISQCFTRSFQPISPLHPSGLSDGCEYVLLRSESGTIDLEIQRRNDRTIRQETSKIDLPDRSCFLSCWLL